VTCPLRAGSPLYVNLLIFDILAKVLAEGKGGIVRFCLKKAGVEIYDVFIDRWCGAGGERM
jgi:hypothetical protein